MNKKLRIILAVLAALVAIYIPISTFSSFLPPFNYDAHKWSYLQEDVLTTRLRAEGYDISSDDFNKLIIISEPIIEPEKYGLTFKEDYDSHSSPGILLGSAAVMAIAIVATLMLWCWVFEKSEY